MTDLSPESPLSESASGSPPVPPRASGKSLRWFVALLILVVAFWLLDRLVRGVGWDEVWRRFTAADPGWLSLAVAAKLGHWAAWSARWRLAVRRLGQPPPYPILFLAEIGGVCANLVAPFVRFLGGVVRARYLAVHSGISSGRAYGSVLFDQVAHAVSMTTLTVGALALGAHLLGRTSWAVGVAVLVVIGAVILQRKGRHGGSRIAYRLADFLTARAARATQGRGRARWLFAAGGEAASVLSDLLGQRGLWRWCFLFSGLLFAANVLAQWAVFSALGQRVDVGTVVVVVALGAAAGLLTGTPGGLGGTEAAMVALYTQLGVDPALAAAGTLLFRGVHYGLAVVAGGPALGLLEALRRH